MIHKVAKTQIIILYLIVGLLCVLQIDYVQNRVVGFFFGSNVTVKMHNTRGFFPFYLHAGKISFLNTKTHSTIDITNAKIKANLWKLCIEHADIQNIKYNGSPAINFSVVPNFIAKYLRMRVNNLYIKRIDRNNINVSDIRVQIQKRKILCASCMVGKMPIKINGTLSGCAFLDVIIGRDVATAIRCIVSKDFHNFVATRKGAKLTGRISKDVIDGELSLMRGKYIFPYSIKHSDNIIEFASIGNVAKVQCFYNLCEPTISIAAFNILDKIRIEPIIFNNCVADKITLRVLDKRCIEIFGFNAKSLSHLFDFITVNALDIGAISNDWSGVVDAKIVLDDSLLINTVVNKFKYKNVAFDNIDMKCKYGREMLEANIVFNTAGQDINCSVVSKYKNWILDKDSSISARLFGDVNIANKNRFDKFCLLANYDLNCNGTIRHRRWNGFISINNIEYGNAIRNVYINNGSLAMTVEDSRLKINNCNIYDIKRTPGCVMANGHIDFDNFTANINVSAQNFMPYVIKRLDYAINGSCIISGNSIAGYIANGSLNLSRFWLQLTQKIAITRPAAVLSESHASNAIISMCKKLLDKVRLNLAVHGEKMIVNNRQSQDTFSDIVIPSSILSSVWSMNNTHVGGTIVHPVIDLNLLLTTGSIGIFGQNLILTRGTGRLKNATLQGIKSMAIEIEACKTVKNEKFFATFKRNDGRDTLHFSSTSNQSREDIVCYMLFDKSFHEMKNTSSEVQILLSSMQNIINKNNDGRAMGAIIAEIFNSIHVKRVIDVDGKSGSNISIEKNIKGFGVGIVHDNTENNDGTKTYATNLKISKRVTPNLDIFAIGSRYSNASIGLSWQKRF